MAAGKEHELERELLLCCARTQASPDVAARIRRLAADTNLDYDYLFNLARRHALIPLLYVQLSRAGTDPILPSYLAKLKLEYQANCARNILLAAELCRLLEIFEDAGIEAIPYKGPALALFAYGDIGLRRFVDLDVIVRKSDVSQARDLLLREDYTFTTPLTAAQQDLLLRSQHNLQFARDQRRILLELHWEIAPHLFASAVQENELWQNLTTMKINEREVKVLSAEDLLFSLCVHGSRHLWERLGWICDVAEIIARHELDWNALRENAAAADSERMLLLGLYLAQKLLQAKLPAEVQQRCAADAHLEPLAANIIEHLFNGPTHVPATPRDIFKFNLRVRKTVAARARYMVHMLRPTDSDVGARFVPRMTFAYYLTRPFRLLLKG